MKIGPGNLIRDLATARAVARAATWAANRRGNVSIEFALVAIVLAVLGVGMFDFGRYGLAHSRAYNAARAGTQYGTLNQSQAGNILGMEAAAFDDASVDPENPGDFDPNARSFCLCPGLTDSQPCGTTCADGGFPPRFVEVTVDDQLELLFDYPGFPPKLPVSSTSRMRVQ